MKRSSAMLCLMIALLSMAPGARHAAASPIRIKPCPRPLIPYELAALKSLTGTETWALFEGWAIEGLSLDRNCRGLPVDYVTIDYVLPAAYSAKNLTYRLRITFALDWQGVLTNAKPIRLLLLNLAEEIAGFEQHPAVEQYLILDKDPHIANYDDVSASSPMDQITLSVGEGNVLVYDLTYRQVLRLRFTDSMLVANKELLVPAISSVPEPAPPGYNTGIRYDAVTGEIDWFDVLPATTAIRTGPPVAALAAAEAQERNRSLLFWLPTLLLGLFVIGMFTKGEAGRRRS